MSPERDGKDLSQFLFRACHDLRTSIRAIRTNAELLLREGATRDASGLEERLGTIARDAGRLDLLADGLARYSIALETDRGEFQPVATGVLLRSAVAKLQKQIQAQEAQVNFAEPPRVWGHPDRLLEVFENLLRNALVHHGAGAPRIDVTVDEQEEAWLFAVRDNGPGVAPVYLEGIFRPFERLDGKKKDGPGLGLTIAKTIVERHGGRIWAESTGAGLAVLFTLPKT